MYATSFEASQWPIEAHFIVLIKKNNLLPVKIGVSWKRAYFQLHYSQLALLLLVDINECCKIRIGIFKTPAFMRQESFICRTELFNSVVS